MPIQSRRGVKSLLYKFQKLGRLEPTTNRVQTGDEERNIREGEGVYEAISKCISIGESFEKDKM